MKLLLLLFISASSQAQVFTEIGLSNNGIQLGAGVVEGKLGIMGKYHNPIVSAEKAAVSYLGALYQHSFSDKDAFTITATAGVASYNYTDGGKMLGYKNSIGWGAGIEGGKDWHMGRLFVSGYWMNRVYIGAGMKVFFR